ncbi:MAG: winged helix DNA-binding domain-containing protein [Acidimicrobiia bacterium]|nr:winged helix DNA-binding domain-containing protein [Acidimicrobiia bacterium]MDJ0664259.1 winged helix DNA-binding domain-containing protein [Acidimicrobiia bacterium]
MISRPLTKRQLNRTTLARQLLLQRKPLGAVDAVRRVVALQAQEPASPYIALWNRVEGFDPAELDGAYADRSVIKASLMRITLHAVAATDYATFQLGMLRTLRAARLNDRRFESTGLSISEADALVPILLQLLAEPRSRQQIEEMLESELGETPDRHVFWALRTFSPLLHAPTGGPWSFTSNAPSYQAAPFDRTETDQAAALQHLIWRYLEGFGPASPADFAQFALHRQAEIRPALAGLADRLVTIDGPNGKLLDIPNGHVADSDAAAPPRLLPMWDSTLLAYRDRSRIIPEEHRRTVIRRNGDVLPTVLVDGYVAGVWRSIEDGIEVTAFRRLSDAEWTGLAEEAAGLVAFLSAREPLVYSRYGNWWKDMPGERRLLAA